ncbi:MAG TPA: amino acid ABC transporter ATP-binding protein [Spirochaetota bacterium]|nr:amino acid ABC transporter ATP-binding protein [Spirochaetota bacterium]HPS86828.1 amino acid ABC transporter ATP-binding protein [Spirochaetota bacterium]
MKMLQARNLYKSFGTHRVLDNVNFEVNKGEVIVIIGPSGSGKSTLLRCFNGLEEIESGVITIENETFACKENGKKDRINTKEKKDIAKKLGMVFQHFNLFPHKTVLENVIEAPITVLGVKKSDAVIMAETLLEKVGLSDKKNAYPSKISGGQKQRVAIARALGMNPDIMLFDEPTSSLDPELVGEVQKVIIDLAREKMTMLIVTHEMRFAEEVADRIIFMDEGKIIADEKPDKIFNNPEHPRIITFIDKISMRQSNK